MFSSRSWVRLSDIVSSLSAALDLTEGQPIGHSVRSCIIGMRLADKLHLPAGQRSDLYYSLLLKDSGCSSTSARLYKIMGCDDIKAKGEVKLEDWSKVSISGLNYLLRNVLPGSPLRSRLLRIAKVSWSLQANNEALIGARCDRGAEIARKIGFGEDVALAIRSLDEHWDGSGYPDRSRNFEIPLLSRILSVSQTLEVFSNRFTPQVGLEAIQARSGRWFDPEIVRAALALKDDEELWAQLAEKDPRHHVLSMEPGGTLRASPERIDNICKAFAEVIDAKSHYTFHHSVGVANVSTAIAKRMCLHESARTLLWRAGLLHDIGKLSVPNSILEKPGKLDANEWGIMRLHPVYTKIILANIGGFEELASIAGAHHERLDGNGYPDKLTAENIPLLVRIISVADVYQALSEDRPYRQPMPLEKVLRILDEDSAAPAKLDPECVQALKETAFGSQVDPPQEDLSLSASAGD